MYNRAPTAGSVVRGWVTAGPARGSAVVAGSTAQAVRRFASLEVAMSKTTSYARFERLLARPGTWRLWQAQLHRRALVRLTCGHSVRHKTSPHAIVRRLNALKARRLLQPLPRTAVPALAAGLPIAADAAMHTPALASPRPHFMRYIARAWRECAWQIATATASAASSGRIILSMPVSILTICCTCALSALP